MTDGEPINKAEIANTLAANYQEIVNFSRRYSVWHSAIHEPEDVAHDAILRVLESQTIRVIDEHSTVNYAKTAVRHGQVDAIRWLYKQRTQPVEDLDQYVTETTPEAGEDVIQTERQRTIITALSAIAAELDPQCSELYEKAWKHWLGAPYDEIASEYDVSSAVLRNLVMKFRKRLLRMVATGRIVLPDDFVNALNTAENDVTIDEHGEG